jgi:hypothetical protein
MSAVGDSRFRKRAGKRLFFDCQAHRRTRWLEGART